MYSHLSNKRGGWNKCGGGAKFAKALNVEVGINVEGGILIRTYLLDRLEFNGLSQPLLAKLWVLMTRTRSQMFANDVINIYYNMLNTK